MTVTYTGEVVTSRGFSPFLKLLIRWKGSIYKLIWKEVIIYLIIFFTVNCIYRFVLDGEAKSNFEILVKYCKEYSSLIPLSFVLGFYVSVVMTRWWNQYSTLPFPDNLSLLVSASIHNQDEPGRLIRRTIVRYACLAFSVSVANISPRVKKRFPTLDHFVESGLLTHDEKKIWEDLEESYPEISKYWLPLAWAASIVTKARRDGLITSDMNMKEILQEIITFRTKCGTLLDYDWISIPLVYTQVVTLAVYSYFLTTVFAQQFIDPTTDLYVPFLTILEFFFYMGWLKVAETLINPFGEDDDDFEVNWLIDRNVTVTYLLADKMHHEHPKLMKDHYWQRMAPKHLPYTVATGQYVEEGHVPSTNKIHVASADTDIIVEPRRITGENIDSKTKARGSWFRRTLFRNNRQNAMASRTHRPVSTDEILDMTNYSTSPSSSSLERSLMSDMSDFDRLKRMRQMLMKQKLKRCVSLFKENNLHEAEEDRIIDELIDNNLNKI